MKRAFVAFLVASVTLMAALTGCSASDGSGNYAIEAKTYPMQVQLSTNDEKTTSELTLYFVDGGDIPYVALSEYLPFVGSVYADKELGSPAAEYEITHPDKNLTMVTRPDNSSMMIVDAEKDTIEFTGMDYFTARPGSNLITSIIALSESGRGGVSNLLNGADTSYERAGELLMTFDMSEYLIDLIEKDGECYVPLQTVNDLLIAPNNKLVVFNGEEVFACSSASDLVNKMSDVPAGQMSEDFAQFNYNELRFALDTHYGLKAEHGIDNFGDYFDSTGLLVDLAGTDPNAFDAALTTLTLRYFDDGHSGVLHGSCLSDTEEAGEGDISAMGEMGASNDSRMWESMRLKQARSQYCPNLRTVEDKALSYEEVGDTAIITFDAFSMKKADYYKEANVKKPSDTVELIAYAQSRISRENSPIKNIVVDLSCNDGGAADAAVLTMAWLNGGTSPFLNINNTLTGAQSMAKYQADVNLDGEFDSISDAALYEANKYILIGGESFSCGNLVPSTMKGVGGITLIGQTANGGACAVQVCSTASGAVFAMSGPYQFSYVRNGSLYNVDQGATPDVFIDKLETMYNRQKLVDFIHALP